LDQDGFGWVHQHAGTMIRCYQPPGMIGSIAVADRSLARAVRRAAAHPATVRRIAIWRTSADHPKPQAAASLCRASSLGIGVVVAQSDRMTELVEPAGALFGRPAVFRWWQAELAYRNWLRSTAPTG
jgi:hypothetical protein